MKRAVGLIIVVIACVVGFLTIRGTMPFMPIFGSSMEPTLQSGSLMIIEPMDPSEIEVGDIVVFNVPRIVREYYNYPAVIAHRVVKISKEAGFTFRTKGDNTGEDPFSTRASDIRGRVGRLIPHLGLPLLFFQSQQGMIFVIVALSLLAFFLYGGEMSQSGRRLQRGIFAPVIQEGYRTNRVLAQKIETTEQKMDYTQQALEKFAGAIELYAQHLSSHTSAIQGLSEASHELKRSAAEQNRVLMNLIDRIEQPRPVKEGREEIISRVEQAMTDLEETTPLPEKKQFPPGCVRVHQPPAKENTFRALHPQG